MASRTRTMARALDYSDAIFGRVPWGNIQLNVDLSPYPRTFGRRSPRDDSPSFASQGV
jgi:hypothetical protein